MLFFREVRFFREENLPKLPLLHLLRLQEWLANAPNPMLRIKPIPPNTYTQQPHPGSCLTPPAPQLARCWLEHITGVSTHIATEQGCGVCYGGSIHFYALGTKAFSPAVGQGDLWAAPHGADARYWWTLELYRALQLTFATLFPLVPHSIPKTKSIKCTSHFCSWKKHRYAI